MAERRGTLITYQGHRCQSVRFRRSRGFEADQSIVVLPAAAFPSAFRYEPPTAPDAYLQEIPREGPQSAEEAAEFLAKPPAALPSTLRFAGTLVIADMSGADYRDPVVVHPLFVQRVERVRTSTNGVAMIQVTLVDERYFWGSRGYLHRWSFNRTRADGTVALDSVQGTGEPFSLHAIAGQVVGSLFRAPRLAEAPGSWSTLTGERTFPRLAPAVLALGEIVRQGKSEDPCLRLDGTVALHKPGEGMVGFAPEGKGPNVQPFPPQVQMWKKGTGPGYSVEPTHPDSYLVVAGQERIATVALDDWEPVLILPDRVWRSLTGEGEGEALQFQGERVFPLTDDLVRALTRGAWGLEGLRKWIFAAPSHQGGSFDESVVQVLRQAWRYWRCPGVEVEDDAPQGAAPVQVTRERPGVEGGESAPTGAAPSKSSFGRPTKPGPNAHLLPLLARAETSGGQRLPVRVEVYRFNRVHRTMTGSRQLTDVNNTQRVLAELKRRIQAAAALAAEPDPFGSSRSFGTPPPLPLVFDTSRQSDGGAGAVSHEQVGSMAARLRTLQRIQAIEPGLAQQYERALVEHFKALDKANGTAQLEAWEIAKVAAALEEAARSFGISPADRLAPDPVQRERLRALESDARRQTDEILRRAAVKRQFQEQIRKSGLTQRDFDDKGGAHYLTNLEERQVDEGAVVYSAALGIVRTSALAGWVEEPGVPSQEYTRFVPKPVRVLFGAMLRPRIDQPPPFQTQTRNDGAVRIPRELSDEVTWFTRAYRRTAAGPEPIDPSDVPTGEGTVVPLELHELIPLEGEGNTAELQQLADEIAAERLGARSAVEGETLLLARAWPVQCDGLVASVEINSRDTPKQGTGIETRVVVGSSRAPDANPLRSRTRPPRLRQTDGARREGLA